MIVISHRGNLNGPDKRTENTVGSICAAVWQGYYCECDVWVKNGNFYLGHDGPRERADKVIGMDKVILHCKDLKAFQKIAEMGIHCFFHNKDLATITSRGWAWFYPSKSRFYGGVNVLPELHHAHKTMNGVFGVCTDFPTKYRIGDLE